MRKACIVLCLLAAVCATAQERPRLYITNHDDFEANLTTGQAATRRISAEQIESLAKACPSTSITSNRESADFVVDWDTKTWMQTSWTGHQNHYVIYNRAGDIVATGHADRISAAAKNICKAIPRVAANGSPGSPR